MVKGDPGDRGYDFNKTSVKGKKKEHLYERPNDKSLARKQINKQTNRKQEHLMQSLEFALKS